MNSFEMPRPDHRTLILGSTGSGKTTVGAWLLSHAPFHTMPYVIIDYKRDKLLNSIDRSIPIGLNELPDKPGLYHLRPNPISDDDAMENWLLKVWHKRNIGLYIDEALRIPANRTGAFEAIQTQGRALRIPTISLSQRPVSLNRFAFSEANHVVALRLTDRRDRKTVSEYVPIDYDADRLPEYHSRWYNVEKNRLFVVRPVPRAEEILERIRARLKPRRYTI